MLSIKVDSITPLKDMNLLVFFENGVVKKYDVKQLISDYPYFEELKNEDLFNLVEVEPGGYGISWNEDLDCSEVELWENGIEVPLDIDDFVNFIKFNTVTITDIANKLNCSRQNVDSYLKRNNINPINYYSKINVFLKSDIKTKDK